MPRPTTTWATCCGSRASSTKRRHSFEQALALRPDYAEAHNNLGIVLWQQGKLEQAVARFEQAIALRPDYAEAHNNLGVVLREQLKLTEARQVFERLQALAARFADAQLGLATCYLVEGGLRARLACVRRATAHARARSAPQTFRAGRANPWPDAACCCWPSKAWAIRSNSSAMPGC